MTKSNVDDQTLDGAADNQSGVSQGGGKSIADAPPNSQEFLELKKQIELTRKELQGLQGRQDKETNDVQRFMGEVKAQMAKGLSFDEAEKAVTADRKAQEKDDLLFKIAQKVGVLDSPSQTPTAGTGGQATNEAANAVLTQYGLDGNDPEVVSKLTLQGAELKAAMADLAFRRATHQPPSPSATSALESRPAPSSDDGEKLAQLQKLQKDPLKNLKEIKKLEGELGW